MGWIDPFEEAFPAAMAVMHPGQLAVTEGKPGMIPWPGETGRLEKRYPLTERHFLGWDDFLMVSGLDVFCVF